MNLEPYILLDIEYNIQHTDSWEDIYSGILMNPVGTNEVWKIREGDTAIQIDNKGLTRTTAEWETALSVYANEQLRTYSLPSQRYYYVSKVAKTGRRPDNTTYTYYHWEIRYAGDHPRNPLPPQRTFPDSKVTSEMGANDTIGDSFTGRYFDRDAVDVGSQANLTDYTGGQYYLITQPTPDIDGKHGSSVDYVFNQQTFVQYNTATGESTTTVLGGNPYNYSKRYYCKVPWTWHDKDINIIILNKNNNYTPTSVNYNVEYSTGSGTGTATNVLGANTYIFNQGTSISNIGLKGSIFTFTHNMKVNHLTNGSGSRSQYDAWNHFVITISQEATV